MKRLLFAAAMPLGIAACSSTQTPLPEVLGYRSPANPDAPGAASGHYHQVIGSYTHRTPVDPLPWKLQNQGQTPTAEPAGDNANEASPSGDAS